MHLGVAVSPRTGLPKPFSLSMAVERDLPCIYHAKNSAAFPLAQYSKQLSRETGPGTPRGKSCSISLCAVPKATESRNGSGTRRGKFCSISARAVLTESNRITKRVRGNAAENSAAFLLAQYRKQQSHETGRQKNGQHFLLFYCSKWTVVVSRNGSLEPSHETGPGHEMV